LGILPNKLKVVNFDRHEECVYVSTSSIHINIFFFNFLVVYINDLGLQSIDITCGYGLLFCIGAFYFRVSWNAIEYGDIASKYDPLSCIALFQFKFVCSVGRLRKIHFCFGFV
jgi:hypothetical protein